nr:vWA domain-containing protein [Planctomycetota bacterium]
PLYLLPDVSESAWMETPPRARAGLRASLALAAISLNQHDRVGIFPFADDVRIAVRPRAGKRRVLQFADELARLEPGGRTDFQRSLRTFGHLKLREGLVAIVSDFFDPQGIEAVVDALRHMRHKLVLVQLVRPSDADPDLQGDVRLLDCETGEGEDVSVTPAVKEGYRRAYAAFNEGLMKFASSRRVGLLRLDVEQPVVPQLAHLFEGGRLAV